MRKNNNRRQRNNVKPTQSFSDGFSNVVGKLGFGQVDNQLSQGYFDFNYLTQNRVQLEAAHRGNWICQALVDRIAEDMTRSGFTIKGTIEPDRLSEFKSMIQRRGLMQDISDGIRWGRLFGGAIALMLIDGMDYEKPFDIKNIKQNSFRGLSVYDRWRLVPDMTNLIQSGRDVGLPEFYTIIDLNIKVHHTWVFRFVGDKLPHYQAVREMLWGASVLENVIDRIVAFESVSLGAANLISRAHLRTIAVKGLRQILAAGGKQEENLIKQFSYIREMQNNEGITLLDSEDNFQTDSYSFTGLDTMMLQFVQQVAGAKRIPLPILFGQSPAGLNATGDSDTRIYYDMISAQQEQRVDNDLKLLCVFYASHFGESAPDDMAIEYNPLWQVSLTEKADIALKTAQTVSMALADGTINREIALKELRQSSEFTGIFSNITDEDLEEAENEVPTPEYNQTEQSPPSSRADLLNQAKDIIGAK